MSQGSPGVNVCMISSTSPTSWAWPTTSTPNPVMAEWTSVSVSFSIAKDFNVEAPTAPATTPMGTFFQSFWRQPGISRVCAISPAAVLYAAFVNEAGTGTVKLTQLSSLSVSTSVAVALSLNLGCASGALGENATAPAASSTTRRAIALLVALRVRLASRRHAAVHSLDSLDCSTAADA